MARTILPGSGVAYGAPQSLADAHIAARAALCRREKLAGGCAVFHEVAVDAERLEPRNLDRQMEQMPQVGGEVRGRYSEEAFGGWKHATRPVSVVLL